MVRLCLSCEKHPIAHPVLNLCEQCYQEDVAYALFLTGYPVEEDSQEGEEE